MCVQYEQPEEPPPSVNDLLINHTTVLLQRLGAGMTLRSLFLASLKDYKYEPGG